MDTDALDPGRIVSQYFAQFGDAGDFDRFLMPPEVNLHLMADALARGTPVTKGEVARTYRVLTGNELTDLPPGALR